MQRSNVLSTANAADSYHRKTPWARKFASAVLWAISVSPMAHFAYLPCDFVALLVMNQALGWKYEWVGCIFLVSLRADFRVIAVSYGYGV